MKKEQKKIHSQFYPPRRMSQIYIPLYRSEEHVAVPVEQLASTEPKDLIRMLVRERVPLEIWLRVAVRPFSLPFHAKIRFFTCHLFMAMFFIDILIWKDGH
jgi:hypothetical protein